MFHILSWRCDVLGGGVSLLRFLLVVLDTGALNVARITPSSIRASFSFFRIPELRANNAHVVQNDKHSSVTHLPSRTFQ